MILNCRGSFILKIAEIYFGSRQDDVELLSFFIMKILSSIVVTMI